MPHPLPARTGRVSPMAIRLLRRPTGVRLSAIATACVLIGGCASTARDLGAAAAPAAVRAGLQEANSPDSQQQLQRLIATKAFENAGRSVGEGVGTGLFKEANKLAGLTPAGQTSATQPGDPAPTGTTQPATLPSGEAANTASPGAAAVAGLTAGGGGLNGLVNSSVQQAFLAATDPRFKEGERALSEAVGEGFSQGMIAVLDKEGPRLGRAVQTQLGPVFQSLIREQIAPAVKDTLENQLAPVALKVWKQGATDTLKLSVRPDLAPDVMKNAENASIGAGRGTTQGLINAGILAADGGLTRSTRLVVYAVLTAVGVIGLALFCLLLLLNLLVFRQLLRRKTVVQKA